MENLESLTLGQVLEKAAAESPDKVAIVDDDRRITYAALNATVDALAAGLAGLGFEKGDRVAIYMKNSLEFVTAFYALQKIGVVVVWVNAIYRMYEAEFVLKNSEAKGLFIFNRWDDYDYLAEFLKIKSNLPLLEQIIVAGEGQRDGVIDFDRLIDTGKSASLPAISIDPQEDLCMLLYTSGTTGRPKGAMIRHYAAVRGAWEYARGTAASADDIFIGILPMSHSYGCGSVLVQPILLQATLVLMDKFEVERAFQLIEREKITLQMGAPPHYILELNHKSRSNYDLTSLRAGLIAGMIAPEGLIARVEKEMGVYLTSFWGATEVGPGLATMCPYPSPLDIREKYVGKPTEGTQIQVVEPVTQKPLPDGEIGELTIRGWHVMLGYWKNPEETAKQIVGGWLFMGDLASRDENGFYKIYGRTKDLINRGGYKIYPYELESLISDHPKVEQVSVVATPNPVLGESICACVIPVAGERLSLKEIRHFIKDKVAPHKLPDELCLMDDFPKLAGGVKLKKFGKGGLTELASEDKNREGIRKP
ncbi:MAG: class I adenylate-forming enzyme family protein [Desulfobacterales bacterium]|jgi:acyl-CoA synthetase (AMP-forming)/AMP-acid ligase II